SIAEIQAPAGESKDAGESPPAAAELLRPESAESPARADAPTPAQAIAAAEPAPARGTPAADPGEASESQASARAPRARKAAKYGQALRAIAAEETAREQSASRAEPAPARTAQP